MATFIRKRDPRYKSHLSQQQKATTSKASMRSSGQSTPRHQASVTFVEQAWQKTSHSKLDDADLEWAVAENEDEEEWECVACSKTFRSEAAWDSHERSKKHMQAVERLKREMMEEAEELGLGGEDLDVDSSDVEEEHDHEELEPLDLPPQEPPQSPSPDPEGMSDEPMHHPDNRHADAVKDEENLERRTKTKSKQKLARQSRAPSPELLSKSERRAQARTASSPDISGLGDVVEPLVTKPAIEEKDSTPEKSEISKRDKRRAREAAKKAKEELEANTPTVSSSLLDR